MSTLQLVNTSHLEPHHAHSVQMYGADERLLAINVGNYIADGLHGGERVLVIATPDHISAFERQLRILGVETARALKKQQLMFLDAEMTLGSFMVDGQPDARLFHKAVWAALDGLGGGGAGGGQRAYGEMVGLLWEDGNSSAAIRLEELWNELLPLAGLQLFCGYPIDIFGSEFQSCAVEDVLRSHTHVISTSDDADLGRAVQRAIEDFAPPHSIARQADTHSFPEGVVIPNAEKAILELKAVTPERAHDVLVHARQYYQTEKRFRALIENSSDATLLTNPQGDIQYASPSTAKVLGYSPREMIGRNCLDLVHPDCRQHAERTAACALANPRQPVQFEARWRTSAGQWRWVESTVTDLTGESAVGGMVHNCRDITERKAAEHALQESERRLAARERYLQALLDSMPECVKVLGADGKVLEMNVAGLRMLEADSSEQVIGKCVYPLVDERDRAAFQSLNEAAFKQGTGGSLEFSITNLSGAHRTFETNVVPLLGEADHVIGALSATRDVTERKAVEAALRHANQGLEEFAYAAAHDLQEPIRNVAVYTELLGRRYGGQLDERANEYMSIAIDGARRMETLVQDLLAYSRSLDTPDGQQSNTDANKVVTEVIANLRTAIETAGAEVVCGNLPRLPVYRAHLIQLLQNLVGNSLKYKSENPPRIEISTLEQADEFVVAVQDNGIGIPPEHRQRIFGVFKRLHGRSVPGNGIGLAICHRIISHYKGRIWIESRQDQGSTFLFTLPRRSASPAQ